uniref:Uncharacterized protein n=1 Tax=viral metagenome TaxID=1070528 RepID=A0A6C0IWW0_9ZZZZ
MQIIGEFSSTDDLKKWLDKYNTFDNETISIQKIDIERTNKDTIYIAKIYIACDVLGNLSDSDIKEEIEYMANNDDDSFRLFRCQTRLLPDSIVYNDSF